MDLTLIKKGMIWEIDLIFIFRGIKHVDEMLDLLNTSQEKYKMNDKSATIIWEKLLYNITH